MEGFTSFLSVVCLWVTGVVAGILPKRVWPRLEPSLPLKSTAVPSGILTLAIGFFLGVDGFLKFNASIASEQNAWMLARLSEAPSEALGQAIGGVPLTMSIFGLFQFMFLTPTGLFSTYLVASGTVRAISGWTDDPRGDFLLSGAHKLFTRALADHRHTRQRLSREKLEGRDVPDVLQTGSWAGVEADFVVLAARCKPEWTAGAIVMTHDEWYRLGEPFNMDTPRGLRTAYPLTRMPTTEVVRRGIYYELPRRASSEIQPIATRTSSRFPARRP